MAASCKFVPVVLFTLVVAVSMVTVVTVADALCPFPKTNQTLQHCSWSDWLPWNCSNCTETGGKAFRQRGLCCYINERSNVQLCRQTCNTPEDEKDTQYGSCDVCPSFSRTGATPLPSLHVSNTTAAPVPTTTGSQQSSTSIRSDRTRGLRITYSSTKVATSSSGGATTSSMGTTTGERQSHRASFPSTLTPTATTATKFTTSTITAQTTSTNATIPKRFTTSTTSTTGRVIHVSSTAILSTSQPSSQESTKPSSEPKSGPSTPLPSTSPRSSDKTTKARTSSGKTPLHSTTSTSLRSGSSNTTPSPSGHRSVSDSPVKDSFTKETRHHTMSMTRETRTTISTSPPSNLHSRGAPSNNHKKTQVTIGAVFGALSGLAAIATVLAFLFKRKLKQRGSVYPEVDIELSEGVQSTPPTASILQ